MAVGGTPAWGERVQINIEEYGPYNQIRYLSQEVDSALVGSDSTVDAEQRLWAREHLGTIGYARQLLLRPHATEEFLLDYIQHEHERYECGNREETPYQSERQRRRCGCTRGTACPLRKGKLFRDIRESDDVAAAVRQVKQDHPNPILLIEAQQKLLRLRSWVIQCLQHILLHVRSDLDVDDFPDSLPDPPSDLQDLTHVPP